VQHDLQTLPFGNRIDIAVSETIAFGAMLSAIAAAYTMGLKDEPGCRFPSIALSNWDSA
jgi:hypothetical protein